MNLLNLENGAWMDGWIEMRFLGMACLFSIFAHVEVGKIKDMHDFWGSRWDKKAKFCFLD
jgi:hypothetical protein